MKVNCMEKYTLKTINENLNKFDYLAKEDDFIEITEWNNGEGWTIHINEHVINLTIGQLEAINYLTKTLEYDRD